MAAQYVASYRHQRTRGETDTSEVEFGVLVLATTPARRIWRATLILLGLCCTPAFLLKVYDSPPLPPVWSGPHCPLAAAVA